ncbi:MAG: ThiF family adenylyltransferase [Dehalococcoidia bacterium]
MAEAIIPGRVFKAMQDHLFRGDQEEHGGMLMAGVDSSGFGLRLLARAFVPARDGIDYVPGERGYRMLTADFVQEQILSCRRQRMAYLAVHNHGGEYAVAFSGDDLASHERGYPALVDIAGGQPVGALVLARRAVAGDVWLPGGSREDVSRTRVTGPLLLDLYPRPKPIGPMSEAYSRQARLFGDAGQARLRDDRVAIVGLGGVGSLLSEYLARLGVGSIVAIDPDRIDESNLSRVVGASREDLGEARRPIVPWSRVSAATSKVEVARRVAVAANPQVDFSAVPADITEPQAAALLLGCDFIFLAADTMQARLVVNAVVNQYLIPAAQVGSKVEVNAESGAVGRVFSVYRPLFPGEGCLKCNGLIDPVQLALEAETQEQRAAQRYVDEPDLPAPSVITLNAIGAARAADEFMMRRVGLLENLGIEWIQVEGRSRTTALVEPRQDANCLYCSTAADSSLAKGTARSLPTRAG